jgi:hypothetical protein
VNQYAFSNLLILDIHAPLSPAKQASQLMLVQKSIHHKYWQHLQPTHLASNTGQCFWIDRLTIPDVNKKWHHSGGRLAGQK